MTTSFRYGENFQNPFETIRVFQHFGNNLKGIKVKKTLIFSLITSNLSFAKPFGLSLFHTDDAFTAQNELLKSQRNDESEDAAQPNGSSHFTVIKHIVFASIWAFVAWNLLTVKEKNLSKYDIAVDFNQTKRKFIFRMSFDSANRKM